MLYQELTGKILQACFEVSKELGPGFLESVYEKALLIALQDKDVKGTNQVPLSVMFRGHEVGQFFADILVDGKVIIELKAVKEIIPEHKAQVINYLKATGVEIGLLVNFGKVPLEYYRLHN